MIEIALTTDEMLAATIVAAFRKIMSDRRRANGSASRRPEHYNEVRTWDQEIESACAELAVCRWRNVYWTGGQFNGAGDAGRMQVRWTTHADGHLIVYTEDPPDAPFVLVTGRSPVMRIVGWAYGSEARREAYWNESALCPSWWVPQADLNKAGA